MLGWLLAQEAHPGMQEVHPMTILAIERMSPRLRRRVPTKHPLVVVVALVVVVMVVALVGVLVFVSSFCFSEGTGLLFVSSVRFYQGMVLLGCSILPLSSPNFRVSLDLKLCILWEKGRRLGVQFGS